LFVLGSQHLDLEDLNATAKQQAGEPGRCIAIAPLPRAAIFEMAETAGIPSFVDREELYGATAGHPLTARYFIEALKGVPDAKIASQLMSFTDGLGRSLGQIYERVWKALEPCENSRRVLALLARANGIVSAEQLALSVNDNAVEDVLSQAGFLLSQSDDGFLSIFHNSFRLFVAGETGKRFGKTDPQAERDLYSELANLAARSPKTTLNDGWSCGTARALATATVCCALVRPTISGPHSQPTDPAPRSISTCGLRMPR
jgi:hypothetical protein